MMIFRRIALIPGLLAVGFAVRGPALWGDYAQCRAGEVPGANIKVGQADPESRVRVYSNPRPLSAGAVTQDWPTFLGPSRNSYSAETKLLKNWPQKGPNLVWEMETGSGYASPAVVRDRLVFFHRVRDRARVECLHPETGKRYWSFSYLTEYKDRYDFANGPRASPVIDDGRVFTHGAEGILHCLNLNSGRLIWKRDISTEFKVPQNFFGVGSTPLVEGDLLIVNVGAPGGPCVVAFDKRTGKTVWQAGDRWGASYSSPVSALLHGRRRIIVFAGGESDPTKGGLLAIDPVGGAVDWRFAFHGRRYEAVIAATPIVADHTVFLSTDYDTGGVLVRVTSDPSTNSVAGGNSNYKVAWKTDSLRAHYATPVYKNGYLYGFDGSGGRTALVCVDWKTGKRMWRVQPTFDVEIPKGDGKDTVTIPLVPGALLAVDGHFLCLADRGHLLWLDLTPNGYKELKQASLFFAKESWTPPVISRGLLYVTQNTRDTIHDTPPRLLCFDLRADS